MRGQEASERTAVEESSHWAIEWKEGKGVESDALGGGEAQHLFLTYSVYILYVTSFSPKSTLQMRSLRLRDI